MNDQQVESTSDATTVTPLWFMAGVFLLPFVWAGSAALFDKWRTWWMERQLEQSRRGYVPKPRPTHTKRRLPAVPPSKENP